MNNRWHTVVDTAALLQRAAHWLLSAAHEAIRARGACHIVLAGGATPRGTYECLRHAQADWLRWHIYFGDERCLPADDAERNSVMARAAWLQHVPIPPSQIHLIDAERGPHAAAEQYAQQLADVPLFDVVLLGLGEDGHTASLFPGNDWGTDAQAPAALAVCNAPKPPPQRVSLSASRLTRSRSVLFLVSGTGKQAALQRWRAGEMLPAAAIRPTAGVDVLVTADALAHGDALRAG